MIAAAIVGIAVASLVAVMGRALVVSQVVAEQASASEAAGRVVAEATMAASLPPSGLQWSLTPRGSDPVGMLGLERQGGGGHTSTRVETVDGLAWLRVAVEWAGPGGRRERLERATIIGSRP